MSAPQKTCDLFCRVIDNFGDIGVCWRLAKQLAAEHGYCVRLFVDDLNSLSAIWPATNKDLPKQTVAEIEVWRWSETFPDLSPASLVIESFACELPKSYLLAMSQLDIAPSWINLEYLTAESWIEGCHLMPSPHPALALIKHFFFPGFTAKTGGLLRENEVLPRVREFQSSVSAQANFWRTLNLAEKPEDEIRVSLFCYDNAPIEALLQAFSESRQSIRCLVPEGKALARVARFFNQSTITVGQQLQQHNLKLNVLPFLQQDHYDQLLWACDLNFVRGEDSFLRAQWANKPMIWQIYPQDDGAHLVKLEAFIALYNNPETSQQMMRHWNTNTLHAAHWQTYLNDLVHIQNHASLWLKHLSGMQDLAANITLFHIQNYLADH